MIETHHLSKLYSRGLYALRDLTIGVGKGEFVFLTGPSGAGKSTLLRLLLLQERPSEGEIVVNGQHLSTLSRREIQEYRRGIGFVFQDFKLIPTRIVLENISFVPKVLGVSPTQQRRKAFQVLKWVGLQHRINVYPHDLSGGEQQRVAIARAVASDPTLLLADEPTGNLDPDLSLEIMNLLREINAGGTTVLVATHDRELIRLVGRRTITLERVRSWRWHEGAGLRDREGWASLWRNRGSGTFAVLAIALAMIVLGALLLTTWNVERLLAQWSSSAEFSVYLRDDASSEQRGAIEALVDQSGVVTGPGASRKLTRSDGFAVSSRSSHPSPTISMTILFPRRLKYACIPMRRRMAAPAHWCDECRCCRASPTFATIGSGWRGSRPGWPLSGALDSGWPW